MGVVILIISEGWKRKKPDPASRLRSLAYLPHN